MTVSAVFTLGWEGAEPVHAVAADVPGGDETIIITVYRPEADRWDNDFRMRRQS